MKNIWSENRRINIVIDILLFLFAINFLHYGQLFLPIICLILFIDRKCKFKVNNVATFIILCLFGITFFVFSFKLGIFSTIGFFLPMIYYIGSNMNNSNEDNIKYVIYILAFGMASHVVLNFACDLIVRGIDCFNRNSHLDFWVWDEFPTTQTAILFLFMIGLIYYIFVYEENKKIRTIGIILFVILMIYEIALGRRTTALLMLISNVGAFLIDYFILKNKNKKSRNLLLIGIALILLLGLIGLMTAFNVFGIQERILKIEVVKKFMLFGFESGRVNIFKQAMSLAPQHLWGGKEISDIIEWEIHDLWFDVFDYAGIVPCIILFIHSIMSMFVYVKFYMNNKIDKKFRFLIFILFIGIFIQLLLEPIITGSSIFFLCSMLVFTMIERLQIDRI